MLADLLVSLVLITTFVLFLHRIGSGGDAWTPTPASRFELGWPRGVQEEEPVHFRTERLTQRRRSEGPLPGRSSATARAGGWRWSADPEPRPGRSGAR